MLTRPDPPCGPEDARFLEIRRIIAESGSPFDESEDPDLRRLDLWIGVAEGIRSKTPFTAGLLREMGRISRKMIEVYRSGGAEAIAHELRSGKNMEASAFFEDVAKLFLLPGHGLAAGMICLETFGIATLLARYMEEVACIHGRPDDVLDTCRGMFAEKNGEVNPGSVFGDALCRALKASADSQTAAITVAFGPGESVRREVQRYLSGETVPPLRVGAAALREMKARHSDEDPSLNESGLVLASILARAFLRARSTPGIVDPELPFQDAFDLVLTRLSAGPGAT